MRRAAAACLVLAAVIAVVAFIARPAPRSARPGALATHATGLAGQVAPTANRHDAARSRPPAGAGAASQGKPEGAGRPGTRVVRVRPGTPLQSVHPRAGHTYLFRRGASYAGTLTVTADNVVIDAYGTGHYPVFSRSSAGDDVVLAGTSDRISHIRLTGHGYRAVPHCGPARTAGYEVGVYITGEHDTVRSIYASGNLYAGVSVEPKGGHATITRSVFDGVNSLNPHGYSSGAFGVLLLGDHNVVDRDVFKNQSTCSPVYGRDGSGVEIYHGSYNLIEHSTGRNDADFTELGGRGATTNTYLDNRFAAPGEFLVTRGGRDTTNGPVANTILIGNIAHGAVVSYGWRLGEGPLLVMRNDHVASLRQDGGYVNQGGVVIGF